MGEADERDDSPDLGRELAQALVRRAHEAGPEQEVLRRVAGHGELGEEDEVGAGGLGLADRLQDPLAVPIQVADGGVDLREREPHQF